MSPHALRSILLVEDNAGGARIFREIWDAPALRDIRVTHVDSMVKAENHLADNRYDVVLLDPALPDAQGLESIRRANAAAPRVPIVVLTGLDDDALASQALQEGAQDYLIKGQIQAQALLRSLRHAVERKITEDAIFAEKERAQITLDCIGDAVACTDASGNISFLNAVAQDMVGWPWLEAAGRPIAEVLRIVDAVGGDAPEPRSRAFGRERQLIEPSSSNLIRRDGREIPIEDSIAPIHDREGRTTGTVIVFRDVSAARARAEQISHSAQHDFLTGLPNRMLLTDRIHQAITVAPRHAKKVAILFVDLDDFKRINDSLGHPIGDKLLQSVGARLVTCVRDADTISRQGGDEFVVLLSEVELAEDAGLTARRMIQAVAQLHTVESHALSVTASIGVSVYPDDGRDAETLIKNADTAMYQAKETGRGQLQFFRPTMNARAIEREFIEGGLRQAVARREFSLHYQPTIDLESSRITGAEAFLRWIHPTRGAIPAAQFLPVAEDCGLMLPIGKWVLREACRQARDWTNAGLPVATMAVNISGMEFRDEKFLDAVFEVLDETGLNPGLLDLELTENILMKHVDATGPILSSLRARGVRLTVDDFGTGYSSLGYLRKFPIETLKIDPSFVRQVAADPRETTLMTAAIAMGRSLGLRVIAEGVETSEELAFLRTQRCDEAQGYLFSPPLDSRRFARLLETGIR